MFEFDSGEKRKAAADGLFLERLDAFMDRSMTDLKAFADRESLSLEETRLYVAEWHSRYLFQSNLTAPDWSGIWTLLLVRTALCDVSRILENLQALSGVHSFVLAVDPTDPAMDGFLGGSWLGRDFWRNLRTGGDSGAKAFKGQCVKHLQATGSQTGESSATSSHSTPAHALKSELYDKVRTSLRQVYINGKKHAEMKWTNPDRLVDSYGVMLVGWPPSIPYQNPSTMKVGQKKELIALLDSSAMRFVKINPGQTNLPSNEPAGNGDHDDYSWALQFTNEDQVVSCEQRSC
ncbi:hypothetical protein BDZ89DRAFT_949195 [Hymenopellis radicata]|nr:hypothetical protein BDZ89DRAFT_949195 [Hymenopellis radicata]